MLFATILWYWLFVGMFLSSRQNLAEVYTLLRQVGDLLQPSP